VSHGGIEPFDGDLDDYQRYLLDEAKRARESLKESLKGPKELAPQAPPAVVVNKKIPENLKVLKRDLGKVEQTILDLQAKKHAIEARLATPLPPQEIGELGLQLQKIDEELSAHEDHWLQLSEQIEAATA
jgi:ATP-binding cassette subfamily F protein 3